MKRTKPKSIDTSLAQRRDALRGAAFYAVLHGMTVLVLLWLWSIAQAGWMQTALLVLVVLNLVVLGSIFVVLKQRLKEIKGGELDAARKY